MYDATHPFENLAFRRLPEEEMLVRARSFFELHRRRRSVRSFSPDPVPRELVEHAIRSAASAPSGANLQPWHFCVVEDPEVKRQIRVAAEKEEKISYQERFPEEWLEELAPLGTDWHKPYLEVAPLLIVVFAQRFRRIDGVKRKNYYVTESVGIACGILIAALHDAGLATLTHTPNPMGFLREILGRPKNEIPLVLLPVGYPADDCRVPRLTRKPLEDIMSWH